VNRNEIEQKLWADQYHWGMVLSEDKPISCEFADAAVAQFRQRYPAEPAAPEAVWYDEPPRPGEYHVEGSPCVCWVDGDVVWRPDWDHDGERACIREVPRNGRRVSPIIKPQEPTQ
jgi:hypothetical protein